MLLKLARNQCILLIRVKADNSARQVSSDKILGPRELELRVAVFETVESVVVLSVHDHFVRLIEHIGRKVKLGV